MADFININTKQLLHSVNTTTYNTNPDYMQIDPSIYYALKDIPIAHRVIDGDVVREATQEEKDALVVVPPPTPPSDLSVLEEIWGSISSPEQGIRLKTATKEKPWFLIHMRFSDWASALGEAQEALDEEIIIQEDFDMIYNILIQYI